MSTLASYLRERLPEGMSLIDAKQLCFRLFCTVDGVPSECQPQCSRSGLADTFAHLSRAGWIRDCDGQTTKSEYWFDVMSGLLKEGSDGYDIRRGEALARLTGFCEDSSR